MATAAAKKSSTTKRRYKIWLVFIALFLGWASYTIFGQLQQQQETAGKLGALQSQLEAVELESKQLQQQVERLNDPEYIAQLATKEQGMVKQGEQQIFSE